MNTLVAPSLSLVLGLLTSEPEPAVAGSPEITAESGPHAEVAAEPGPQPESEVERLYREGEAAYRLGRYQEALDKWEESYARSENALILYNIALAYKGLYDVSGDIVDLRKARAVMDNFRTVVRNDPTPDAEDASHRIAELDDLITDAESQARSSPSTSTDDTAPARDPLRIAGLSLLGAGGAVLLGGTGAGVFFGIRGQEFKEELRIAKVDRLEQCAEPDSAQCMQQDIVIANAQDNGRRANLGMGLSLGLGAGLGAVGLSIGAVLFVRSKRRETTEPDVLGRLHVVPTGRGLAVSGRF